MELKEVDTKNFEDKVTKTNTIVLVDFLEFYCQKMEVA